MSSEEYEAIIRQQGEALTGTLLYSFFLTIAAAYVLIRWGVRAIRAKVLQRFAAPTQATLVEEEPPMQLAEVLARATPGMRRHIEKGLLATAIQMTPLRGNDD